MHVPPDLQRLLEEVPKVGNVLLRERLSAHHIQIQEAFHPPLVMINVPEREEPKDDLDVTHRNVRAVRNQLLRAALLSGLAVRWQRPHPTKGVVLHEVEAQLVESSLVERVPNLLGAQPDAARVQPLEHLLAQQGLIFGRGSRFFQEHNVRN